MVAPQGMVIAGWPVTLNNCVSLSVMLRRALRPDPIFDRGRAQPERRAPPAPAAAGRPAAQRGIDLFDQQVAASQRAHVVLRQDVSPHFKPDADIRRVVLGMAVERLGVNAAASARTMCR